MVAGAVTQKIVTLNLNEEANIETDFPGLAQAGVSVSVLLIERTGDTAKYLISILSSAANA